MNSCIDAYSSAIMMEEHMTEKGVWFSMCCRGPIMVCRVSILKEMNGITSMRRVFQYPVLSVAETTS